MTNPEYEVVVVGARVAGSTVAALLGDAGRSVLLVDGGAFPSPTLSTHFFRGGGLLTVLQRLGVLEQVMALGSPRLVHDYFFPGGAEQPVVGPPQNPGAVGYCLSVRREPLDYILLQRATESPSVHFRERSRVVGLLRDGDRVVGVRLVTPDGEQSIRTRFVVGADGRRSLVARMVSAPDEQSDPPYRALYYRYVSGYVGSSGHEPDGAEFSHIEDELAYVFPSDSGLACVALSISSTDFARMRKALSRGFAERIGRHRGIAGRFNSSNPEGRLLGCGPEPNYVRRPVGPGWALVGDAGMHQDPWSGMGMDMAGVHATFLSEAILDWLDNSSSEDEALSIYHKRRNEDGLASYKQTVTLAADLRQHASD